MALSLWRYSAPPRKKLFTSGACGQWVIFCQSFCCWHQLLPIWFPSLKFSIYLQLIDDDVGVGVDVDVDWSQRQQLFLRQVKHRLENNRRRFLSLKKSEKKFGVRRNDCRSFRTFWPRCIGLFFKVFGWNFSSLDRDPIHKKIPAEIFMLCRNRSIR